jgi:cation transport ATPase
VVRARIHHAGDRLPVRVCHRNIVSVVSETISAGKHGVLREGGNYLEAMGDVDAIAVDNTAPLPRGELAVTDVFSLGDASDEADSFFVLQSSEAASEMDCETD